MSRTAVMRIDVHLDAVTARPAPPAEVRAFRRAVESIKIEIDVGAATVHRATPAEVDAFHRGDVPVSLPRGRWLTYVHAFDEPSQFDVQLGLDSERQLALAEALGELAGRAWREGRFQP